MPSNGALRLPCKVNVFAVRLKTEKHKRIAGVSTSLHPFRCTLHFGVDVESKRLFVRVLVAPYSVDY